MQYQEALIITLIAVAIAYVAYKGGHTVGYLQRMIEERKELNELINKYEDIHAHDEYAGWADCKMCNPFYEEAK